MPADVSQFSAALLRPDAPVPLLVKGQSERRYAVYRNNVTVGLIRALESNFPAVRRLLGETYFAGFAREFVQSHPPVSPVMFVYGVGFPEALQDAEDLSAYPFLADVARLEILWREAYHASDMGVLDGAALQSLGEEELFSARFNPHPALRLMASRYAIHSIFQANRGPDAVPVQDAMAAERVIITRPALDVLVSPVSPAQHSFFVALHDGATLAEAAELAADEDPGFDLGATLTLALQNGAFTSVSTESES